MRKSGTSSKLKEIMNQRGLRQIDVINLCKPYCDKYGISHITSALLSQYLTGKCEPMSTRLTVLAQALNVSEAWLMGYDVPMERENPNSMTSKDNSQTDSKEDDEFSDLSAQEKTLIRLFREVSEEGRLEMISAFMNIIKKYRKDVRIIYRAASSSNNEDHRLEVRTEADLEKFKKATPVTSEDDL